MMRAIHDYVNHGLRPGDFLSAVIRNDLKEAVARADSENLRNLPAFVAYFYNEVPAICWGSSEAMDQWIEMHRRRAIRCVTQGEFTHTPSPAPRKENGKD